MTHPVRWAHGLLRWTRKTWLRRTLLGLLLILCSSDVLLDARPIHPGIDRPVVMEMDVDECDLVPQVTTAIAVPFARIRELRMFHPLELDPREMAREPEHAPPRQV